MAEVMKKPSAAIWSWEGKDKTGKVMRGEIVQNRKR